LAYWRNNLLNARYPTVSDAKNKKPAYLAGSDLAFDIEANTSGQKASGHLSFSKSGMEIKILPSTSQSEL